MRLRALIASTALALAATVALAAPASAHDALVDSIPASGTEVAQMPESLTLIYTANVLEGTFEGRLNDAAGTEYPLGAASFEGTNVVVEIPEGSYPAGEYTLLWKVASSDGHPISATEGNTNLPPVTFTVTEGSAPETPSEAPSESTAPGSEEPSATAEATTSPSDAPSDDAGESALPFVLGGAIALVVVGAIVTVVLARRRKP